MADALKVRFDDPQNGWMAMTIRSDETIVTLLVSYVLYNTLDELVDGLHALTTGDNYRSVRIFEEPTTCEMRFRRENGTIRFELCRFSSFSRVASRKPGQMLFEIEGTLAEVCLPFWRALRNLQTRFSEDEFQLRWRRPFPGSGMQKLRANLSRLLR